MRLVLFDLDHTLLPIDSADTWSRFLVERGGLDREREGARIRSFAADYRAGHFDVEAYLAWQMGLLARFDRVHLDRWRDEFMREAVAPHLRPEARALIERHRKAGDTLALVTGTHAYVTAPIAAAFGIEHLLAVQPEEEEGGRFTGRYVGTHTYQQGKVRAVLDWLARRGQTEAQVAHWTFYSDSINDLPLLEFVAARGGLPVVTHGDARLRGLAVERGWPQLQLFEHDAAAGHATRSAVPAPRSLGTADSAAAAR
jgi:HAD superfamily hydrolase (TIGR01490 family)